MTKLELKGRARLRAEIVEMTEGLHRAGLATDDEVRMTTLRMLGKDAPRKLAAVSGPRYRETARADRDQSTRAGRLLECRGVDSQSMGAQRTAANRHCAEASRHHQALTGDTIGVVTLEKVDVRPTTEHEIAHARQVA